MPLLDPELLTITRAAETLSISTRHLWRLIAAGKIPQPLYVGERAPRIRRQWLLDYVTAVEADRHRGRT